MRIRLRYVLPIVMVLVRVAFEWWDRAWRSAYPRIGLVKYSPPWEIQISINLPAFILREFLYEPGFLGRYFVWLLNICANEMSGERIYLYYAVEYAIVAVSWSFIGWYIDLCLKRGALVRFKRHRERFVLDLIMIVALILFGLWGVEWFREGTGYQMYLEFWRPPFYFSIMKWFIPVLVIQALWFIVPIYFFARDAVLCVKDWRKVSAG
jgi:hypothetical protein